MINESLSKTVNEIDIFLENGGKGSFETSKLTELRSYVLKTSDRS